MAYEPKKKRLEKSITPEQEAPAASQGAQKYTCSRCSATFSRQRSFFPASHSPMYRGVGYIPICNTCVDSMYMFYKARLGSDREAVRRMCMKLDIYWCDELYSAAINKMNSGKSGMTLVRAYIACSNIVRFIDKNYDDTILEEEAGGRGRVIDEGLLEDIVSEEAAENDYPVATEEVIAFWGPGYTDKMYSELESRREYWLSKYPENYEFDIGEEALIRQICNLEIDINHDRVAGRPADRNINTLNTLLGSANLKPTQKRSDESGGDVDGTPLGVWIKKWETKRPIPEPDPELKDVDKIIRYITIWFFGHACKMLGKNNVYSKLYEKEIAKYRVLHPEFQDEDDEAVFNAAFDNEADTDG